MDKVSTPKRLTPLQEAIGKFNSAIDFRKNHPDTVVNESLQLVVKILEFLLPSEQKLLEETWDAGSLYGSNDAYWNRGKLSRTEWENTIGKDQFLNQFKPE